MKDSFFDEELNQGGESVDMMALLFRYLNNWYYFLASILLVCGAMVIYIKTLTPIYQVDASVIIEDPKDKKSSGAAMDFANLGIFSASSNFDNELELLRSRTLVKNTVVDLGLNISYAKEGLLRPEPLYKNSPINVWMSIEECASLPSTALLSIEQITDSAIHIDMEIHDKLGEKICFEQGFDALPASFETPFGTLLISAGEDIYREEWQVGDVLRVSVSNPTATAKRYLANLVIEPSSKTTTIANIALEGSVAARSSDFIVRLVDLYNKQTNDYKNEVALKTSEFINDRIAIINRELGLTEREIEIFKREAGITDIVSDAQITLSESSAYKQRSVENSTQLRLVDFLSEYASSPESKYEVLPINVGLSDAGLSQLIASYNEMLLERKRLLLTSSESNPTVVKLDVSIASMRSNVLTTIASVKAGLLITQSDIEREAKLYAGRISSVPTQEREFISISRQQEIQSTLYLMLLQKREENALTLASTANNARIFNEPLASTRPVAPNKKLYMLVALILALGVPIFIIYLKDLFSFNIVGRSDVEKITTVPVLADIPSNSQMPEQGSVVVEENKNDIMAEAFRSFRTNLLFMFKPGQKVAMVTSTSSGEGKSFISSNIAVSLALMGKKVVIVGLDIRKPGLNKAFNMSGKLSGISNYLANPSIDLLSLIQTSPLSPNLSILFGGTIPPNPTELLSRDALDRAIDTLKEEYDYIILDTAPIGMVTDTQIISRVADLSIYVCRAKYTNKSDYHFINELQRKSALPNLTTVINAVDLRRRGYGYYGYGNRYGHGYGYGYEQDGKLKKR
ncbi:MAG: polysaccharide biosynthesis tyrosine autokinase [Rikenellaceae bacterium]